MDEYLDETPLDLVEDVPAVQVDIANEQSAAPSDNVQPAPRTYVRQRPPRRTMDAIDDLAEDDNPMTYTHESNIAIGGVVQDGSYRRARASVTQFQKNNRYGQYLEVPKGRRSIFAKQERKRRRQSAIAALIVVALLVVIAYVVWQVMSNLSFGSLILGERTAANPLLEAVTLAVALIPPV